MNTSEAQNIVLLEALGVGVLSTLGHLGSGRGFPPVALYPAVGVLAVGLMVVAQADAETAIALGGIAVVGTGLAAVVSGKTLAEAALDQISKFGSGLQEVLSGGESASSKWQAAFATVAESAQGAGAAADPRPTQGPPAPASTQGGAKGIVESAVALARSAGGSGVGVVSSYRPGSTVGSGAPSDHASDDANRAARDIAADGINALTGPPSPKLDAAAAAIGKSFGRNYGDGKRTIIDTFSWNGYRVQIIWRTPLYGGHMGHIHIGVRKL